MKQYDPKWLRDLEGWLGASCRNAIANGYKITPEITFDQKRRQCCPIGTYFVEHYAGGTPVLFEAADHFGLDDEAAALFGLGFDADLTDLAGHCDPFVLLGQKFRRKYVGDKP